MCLGGESCFTLCIRSSSIHDAGLSWRHNFTSQLHSGISPNDKQVNKASLLLMLVLMLVLVQAIKAVCNNHRSLGLCWAISSQRANLAQRRKLQFLSMLLHLLVSQVTMLPTKKVGGELFHLRGSRTVSPCYMLRKDKEVIFLLNFEWCQFQTCFFCIQEW